MKKVELQLTKESIVNEGIEIKLTQSDVIDALVEEQINSIVELKETLQKNYYDLLKLIEKEVEDYKNKLAAKQKTPKELTVLNVGTATTGTNFKGIKSISEYTDSRGTVKYSQNNHNVAMGISGSLFIIYSAEISGITMEGKSNLVPFNFKHSKKVVDFIEQHNAKVKEFIEMVPAKGINEKEIAKRIKNQFTKEILKTSSVDFRKKLKEGFAVDL